MTLICLVAITFDHWCFVFSILLMIAYFYELLTEMWKCLVIIVMICWHV